VIAFLYLPKNVSPPYQTVVHFQGSEALDSHTFTDVNLFNLNFLMKRPPRAIPDLQGNMHEDDACEHSWFE
jgi:hypothetical protein